jgi:hypothetical protein
MSTPEKSETVSEKTTTEKTETVATPVTTDASQAKGSVEVPTEDVNE